MRRSQHQPRVVALIAVSLAVLLVGCNREGGSIWDKVRTPQPGTASSPTQTPGGRTPATATPVAVPTRDLSEEDLGAMVLTLAELGDDYSTFERDAENSGPQTRTDRIDDACDPQDETNDLEKTHWVVGYDQVYGIESTSFLLSGPTEGQTFLVGSSLDLYRDELGAGDDFRDSIHDMEAEAGGECQGLSVEGVQELDAPRIGDETLAINIKFKELITGSAVEGIDTAVGFRRGRIVAGVHVARLGDEDAREEATRLARKLDEKIAALLSGEEPPAVTPGLTLRQGVAAEVFGSVTCLNVREAPSKSAKLIECLVDGTKVYIEGGPADADGYRWWKLRDLGWATENWLRPSAE